MKISGLEASVGQTITGQLSLILCCGFYLIWWLAAFRPGKHGTTLPSGICLGIAVVCGLIGVIFSIKGMVAMPVKRDGFTGRNILAVGIAVYIILLAVTRFAMHRKVTTELILIVGWATLEVCILSAAYRGEFFSARTAVVWSIAAAAAMVISLVCYILYYGMSDKAGYIDGIVPLVLAAMVTGGISLNLYLVQ